MLKLTAEKKGEPTEVFELVDAKEQCAEAFIQLLNDKALNRDCFKCFLAIAVFSEGDHNRATRILHGETKAAINAALSFIATTAATHPEAERVAAAISDDIYKEIIRLAKETHAPTSPIFTPPKKKLIL